jgi:hypothetical protein
MNTPASDSFRGSRAVTEVIARVGLLADHLQSLRPNCTVITLRASDLDVLRRYPQAASALFNVVTNNGSTYWRNFELRADRFGKSSTRFEAPPC